jgi:hypothetical protein
MVVMRRSRLAVAAVGPAAIPARRMTAAELVFLLASPWASAARARRWRCRRVSNVHVACGGGDGGAGGTLLTSALRGTDAVAGAGDITATGATATSTYWSGSPAALPPAGAGGGFLWQW